MILNLFPRHVIYKNFKFNVVSNFLKNNSSHTSATNLFEHSKFGNEFLINLNNEKLCLNDHKKLNTFAKFIFDDNLNFLKLINEVYTNDHPSLNIIRYYFNNLNSIPQAMKPVVNLFASALNFRLNFEISKTHRQAQKLIAETVELLYLGHLIHFNILNLPYTQNNDVKQLLNANKISILSGDLCLTVSMQLIANIFNDEISILFADSVNKMTIGQFTLANSYDYLIENCNIETWKVLNYQIFGSNMETGCKSLAELLHESTLIKNLSGEFGKNFSLAYQASIELNQFKEFLKNNLKLKASQSNEFDLISAPILLDIDNLPKLINEINKKNINQLKPTVGFQTIKKYLNSENLDLSKTKKLINNHANQALKCLESISSLEKNKSLVNLIYSLMQK